MSKEVSDELWEVIEPLVAPFKRTRPGGSPPIPFRSIFNGILHLLKTGCQWDMIPRCYGAKSTIYEHFQRWKREGVFDNIFKLSSEIYDELEGIEWTWQAMDGSLIQAPTRQAGGTSAHDEGLGKNPTDRGRQGSKLHILVDQNGIPLGFEIVGANVHDSKLIGSTLKTLTIKRPDATEESPQNMCMDKGYFYKRVKDELEALGYEVHIRPIGEEKLDASQKKTYQLDDL